MSKTSQRKQSAYDLGYSDGKKAFGYRYSRHPLLSVYKAGHKKGWNELIEKDKK